MRLLSWNTFRTMSTVNLSDGTKIPIIGLGSWNADRSLVKNAIKTAIQVGYRHFDCALVYENEDVVGEAISEKVKEGIVTRKDLYITTKVWCTYHSRDKVKECLRKSLKDLKMDYVDLYLIHWPMGFKEGGDPFPKDSTGKILYSDIDYLETWKGMEDCRKAKLCRSIGLSNFNSRQIQRLWDNCEMKPVMNQVECHLYFTQEKLFQFCKEKNIAFTAYSCLGSPARPWKENTEPVLLDDPIIVNLAKNYNKTPAQICLRYLIQLGMIVIPKSTTTSRIESNFKVFDFQLVDDHMYVLRSLHKDFRAVPLQWVNDHPHYPFSVDF